MTAPVWEILLIVSALSAPIPVASPEECVATRSRILAERGWVDRMFGDDRYPSCRARIRVDCGPLHTLPPISTGATPSNITVMADGGRMVCSREGRGFDPKTGQWRDANGFGAPVMDWSIPPADGPWPHRIEAR